MACTAQAHGGDGSRMPPSLVVATWDARHTGVAPPMAMGKGWWVLSATAGTFSSRGDSRGQAAGQRPPLSTCLPTELLHIFHPSLK